MSSRPKTTRWDEPPQHVPQLRPLLQHMQPPFQQASAGDRFYYDPRPTQPFSSTNNKVLLPTPPGSEGVNTPLKSIPQKDTPPEKERRKGKNRGRSANYRRFKGTSAPYEGPGGWRSSTRRTSDRRNLIPRFPVMPENQNSRFMNRRWGRGGLVDAFKQLAESQQLHRNTFEQAHLVLSGVSGWVDANKALEESRAAETESAPATGVSKEPVPGSDEERLKKVKETAEWLKNKMKDKDVTHFDSLLKEKTRQKVQEQTSTSTRNETVNPLNSALEADSIETVKKNLSVLPDESNLLSSLLKDCTKKSPEEGVKNRMSLCGQFTKEEVEILQNLKPNLWKQSPEKKTATSQSSSGALENIPHSSSVAKPKSPVCSASSASNDGLLRMDSTADSTKRASVLHYLQKYWKISNIGHLRDLLTNPRPGKFESFLKEQIKKYRLKSCNEVRMSGEPFTDTEKHIKIENEDGYSEEDYNLIASLGEFTDTVDLDSLPSGFVHELGEMLGLDFLGGNMPTDEAVNDESPVIHDPAVAEPPMNAKIRIKDFARVMEENSTSPNIPSLEEASARGTKQEADTTMNAPHPLDGPNLFASVSAAASSNTGTSAASSNTGTSGTSAAVFPVPNLIASVSTAASSNTGTSAASSNTGTSAAVFSVETTAASVSPDTADKSQKAPVRTIKRGRRAFNIIEQEVFFSGEDCGKKRKPRKKSENTKKVAADSSNDDPATQENSLVSYGSEQSLESSVTSKPQDPPTVSEVSDEEDRSHYKSLDEPQILARLQEICVEMSTLNRRLKKLEKDRAYLYSLLPFSREAAGDTSKRKRRASISSSSDTDGESRAIQEIMAKERACLSNPGSPPPELCTENDNRNNKKKRKNKTKKNKYIISFDSPSPVQTKTQPPPPPIPAVVPVPVPATPRQKPVARGSLAFLTRNASFTLTKDVFPKELGVISQIKVLRKLVLASSSLGKVFSISGFTGKVKKVYDAGTSPVKCFILAETGSLKPEVRLYVGSGDGLLHCFDLQSGEKTHRAIRVSNEITCLDSKWGHVYIGTKGGCVMQYDIESKKLDPDPLSSENGIVYGVNCTNEGPRKVLIVASEKNAVELKCATNGLLLRRLCVGWGGNNFLYAVDVNLDRVFCSKSMEIAVYQYSTGMSTGDKYKLYSNGSCMCIFNGILYVGCRNGAIRRYDIKTNQILDTYTGNRDNVVCMDVIDGKILLARTGGEFDVINIKKTGAGQGEERTSMHFRKTTEVFLE